MGVLDLIVKLHLEEDKKGSEKKGANTNNFEAKANVVEHDQS